MENEYERNMKFEFDMAGMTNIDTGDLLGYIPENFGIWVPPEPQYVEELNITLEEVYLNYGEDLTFFVPKEWAEKKQTPEWKTRLAEIGWTQKTPSKSLLDEFISLANDDQNGSDEKILDFAKKWGPLWEHNKFSDINKIEIKEGYVRGIWPESLFVWKFRAKQVKTILEIASQLNQDDKTAPLSMWETLISYGKPLDDSKKNLLKTREQQKEYLSRLINVAIFIDKGSGLISKDPNIILSLDWSGKEPALLLHSRLGFIHAVWYKLMQAVARQEVCICDTCFRVYIREGRKPKRGQKNHCDECGKNSNYRKVKSNSKYKK